MKEKFIKNMLDINDIVLRRKDYLCRWKINSDGIVTIMIKYRFEIGNKTRIRTEKIKLNNVGSIIWKNIDGKNSIKNIVKLLNKLFTGVKEDTLLSDLINFITKINSYKKIICVDYKLW